VRVIAVDIGNTKGCVAVLQDLRVTARLRRRYDAVGGGHPMADLYEWCRWQIQRKAVDGAVVSSVVPSRAETWRSLWERSGSTRSIPLREIDEQAAFPFEVGVDHPETVGADRWCNLAGAILRGHRSALVVDLGTANTYDLLLEGVFRGGWIAPGLVTSHRAVLRGGAQLPELEFGAPSTFPGRDTREAIRGGSWLQGWGGVAAVIDGFLREHPGLPVLVTGGLAERFPEAVSVPSAELTGDLTLEGAAWLFERALSA